jgi:hypothetical protein
MDGVQNTNPRSYNNSCQKYKIQTKKNGDKTPMHSAKYQESQEKIDEAKKHI